MVPDSWTLDARYAQGAQFGDHNVLHISYAGRAPISWPHQIGVVPRLADGYQPREVSRALHLITAAEGPWWRRLWSKSDRRTAASTQVLSGLGGVGKTQLAAAYAHKVWSQRQADLLMWITATSRQAVISGYAQAATDILGVDDGDAEQTASRILAWLVTTDKRWLIVLDDLQAPADLNGLWPPTTRSGTVLVTTRRRDAALSIAGRQLIEVGLFTPGEAVTYLRHKRPDDPAEQLEQLAADLGNLPLALAQATAYMADRGLDCAAYSRRLADQKKKLADLIPEPAALPDEHQATVAATWSLSVEGADQLHPVGLARPVLDLAALLDPNGIPTAVFTTSAVTEYLATSGKSIDADTAADALRNLHRVGLITHDLKVSSVRIHALVQRATRDQLTAGQLATAARAAAGALVSIWPEIERDPGISQALRANTAALLQGTGDALFISGAHPLLFRAERSLGEANLFSPAISAAQRLVADCLRVFGPEHPHTLVARNNLSYWRGRAGDSADAAKVSEQLLADQLRVLGPDHPITLTTRSNLARWRGEAGDALGAHAAFEQVLADCLRVLGPDHPQTLGTRRAVARWRGEAGDAAGAHEAFEQVLADCLRVLGPDHPDTLTTRIDTARWRGEAGDAAGAHEAFEQVLADCLRVLGPDHPDTLTTRGNLARWRGRAGDRRGAIKAFEQLLADQLRVLGPDHPETFTTRNNLAFQRAEAGDAAGAAKAFEQLLADRLRVLGPDHPQTLATRYNLAFTRGEAGDAAGAATALERLLADRLRVLGPDHPHTLLTRDNLAYWREQAGPSRKP